MPVETSSLFSQVIQEHLELKRRNAELEGDMPLKSYEAEDPFDNHPLFKSEEQARLEASRCLQCFLNIELRPDLCILCGGCVDICPENCIGLVTLDRVEAGDDLAVQLEEENDVVIRGASEDLVGSVMIKDEDICIRCGLCAMRCPVGCITMEGYSVAEALPA